MRYLTTFVTYVLLLGCAAAVSAGDLKEAINRLNKATTEKEKFYALNDAAKQSFNAGNIKDAQKYADELKKMAAKFKGDWNYGNAIHDSNMVLGRIAVSEGRIDDAKRLLLEAGKTPGSPQLNSFGPNMSLAKDLLEKKEQQTVLEYFQLCRKFWELGRDDLDKWTKTVEGGRIPDFGANLLY